MLNPKEASTKPC